MLVLLAIFGQQSHDYLAFNDTRRFRHCAQASKECCGSFRRARNTERSFVWSDRLRLSSECLFCLLATTQCRPLSPLDACPACGGTITESCVVRDGEPFRRNARDATAFQW